jgi:endonuclease/exonuclease/phosphatase family metal-dependent hydrolase
MAGAADVVRVMTWNIRYDNPDDGVHAWPNRRDSLLAYVLSQRPDILCIQEGLHDQVEFLKSGLRGFDMRGVGRDDGAERGEYSAIWFDAARFTLLDNGTFWLSPTPSVPGKGWDAALPRIVTWVRLADSSAARTFFVFNTHFDHQGVEARGKSAQLLRRKIGEIARRSPAIVAGDFNAVETDPPYLILTSPDMPGPRLEDGQMSSLSPHEGPKATFTGFELKDPDPGERIDYLFVSRSLQVLSHTTCDARRKEGFLSDHLPVVADIALFPRP